jgi:hypothetical protein
MKKANERNKKMTKNVNIFFIIRTPVGREEDLQMAQLLTSEHSPP